MEKLALKAGCTMILTVSLQFAKQESTVFKSAEQHSEKAIFHTCPICSGSNISLIAIANDIFRKLEVDKMSGMFRTLLRSIGLHSTGHLFIALGQNIRNLNFYSPLAS